MQVGLVAKVPNTKQTIWINTNSRSHYKSQQLQMFVGQLQLRFSDQILASLCLFTPPCPHVINLVCHTNVIPPQKLTLIVKQIVTLTVTQT